MNISKVAAAVLFISISASAAWGQSPRVSINARESTVQAVASMLSRQSGLDIRVAPGVTDTVDLSLTNVMLEDALDAVARAAYLRWQRLLAPKGATSEDIQASLRAAQQVVAANVILERDGNEPSVAVISGEELRKLRTTTSDMGFDVVYWIYEPSVVANTRPAAATTDRPIPTSEAVVETSGNEAEAADATAPSAAEVYDQASRALADLPPDAAAAVVDRLGADYFAMPSAPAPVAAGPVDTVYRAPFTGHFLRPRVRISQPAGPGFIPWQGYGWLYY